MEDQTIKINENVLYNCIFSNIRHLMDLGIITPKDAVKVCDSVLNPNITTGNKNIQINILKIDSSIMLFLHELGKIDLDEIAKIVDLILKDIQKRKI